MESSTIRAHRRGSGHRPALRRIHDPRPPDDRLLDEATPTTTSVRDQLRQRPTESATRASPKPPRIDLSSSSTCSSPAFDLKSLNTLWVDKNLRAHGLIQAFSRTNRILNSVTYGNIARFRNLEQATEDAIALFRQQRRRVARSSLRPYGEYLSTYLRSSSSFVSTPAAHRIDRLPKGTEALHRPLTSRSCALRNILTSFDDFDDTIAPARARRLPELPDLYHVRASVRKVEKETDRGRARSGNELRQASRHQRRLHPH